MSEISNAYINALLTDASYIDFEGNQIGNNEYDDLSDRITPTLASYIKENFEILSSLPDSENIGFNCVVWRGRTGTDYAGQVFVSMRGTQGVENVLDDATLATTGVAYEQIADMVNWWLRVNNPSVQNKINFSSALSHSGRQTCLSSYLFNCSLSHQYHIR